MFGRKKLQETINMLERENRQLRLDKADVHKCNGENFTHRIVYKKYGETKWKVQDYNGFNMIIKYCPYCGGELK